MDVSPPPSFVWNLFYHILGWMKRGKKWGQGAIPKARKRSGIPSRNAAPFTYDFVFFPSV
jgi:hypothetical protein